MLGIVATALNNLRVAKRLAPRRDATLGERFGRLDDRLVFIIGSPRSGTTFLAGAIGSLPGFVDLGEVAPVKASFPELAALPPGEAAGRLRRILAVARRVGLVGSVRAVEQTPELAHVARALPLAYPEAQVVHIVRDGRRRRLLAAREAVAAAANRRASTTPAFPTVRTLASGSSPSGAEEFEARERRASGCVGMAELRDRRALGRRTARSRSATRMWSRTPPPSPPCSRRSSRLRSSRWPKLSHEPTDRRSAGTAKDLMPSSWQRSKPKPARLLRELGYV